MSLDKKISQLPAATGPVPGNLFAIVQNGETKKIDYSDLFAQQLADLSTLNAAISAGTLIPGAIYYLTNVQVTMAETIPAKIYLQAAGVDKLNPNALRLQLVPDYSTPFWSSVGSYSIGDKVIWGSRVWENLNGNVGTSLDALTLDSEWSEVPYVAGVDYSEIIIPCVYDINNDIIVSQELNGIKVQTSVDLITGVGHSCCDYSDWGQSFDVCGKVYLLGIGFLNNPNLTTFANVTAVGVINNLCVAITNCQAIADKLTTAGGDASIVGNECQDIANISNFTSIKNIPSSVISYVWVTDEETGYIEFDLDTYPILIGTIVIGCITDIDKAICEVTMNCDGGLPGGVTFDFGIDTDDPTHVTMTSNNINTAPQRDTTISARTTAFNRELVLSVTGGDANSGKLWITYKYI